MRGWSGAGINWEGAASAGVANSLSDWASTKTRLGDVSPKVLLFWGLWRRDSTRADANRSVILPRPACPLYDDYKSHRRSARERVFEMGQRTKSLALELGESATVETNGEQGQRPVTGWEVTVREDRRVE